MLATLKPAGVLFDLDGTLLDTAPDMGRALNQLLQEQGRSPLPAEVIRPVVSHGSLGLIKLGFDIDQSHSAFESLRDRFLAIYQTGLAQETILFEGMAQVLVALEQRGAPWGIVTNKPGWLTEPLLAALGLLSRATCVVSGDTLTLRKPDPAPLLYACAQLELRPEACVYIGDAERDIEAARRANMPSLVACYGYIQASETPHAWGATAMIQQPLDLLAGFSDG